LETNHNMSNDNVNTNSQCLSDLLDDQCSNEAIEQLLDSDELQAKAWYRYNAVQSVLNKEHSVHSSFEFTQSISAQIAEEPSYSVFAERNTKTNVVSLFPAWKKTVGGLAMAASVAFAMVFSVQMMNSMPEGNGKSTEVASQQQVLLPAESSLSAFDFKAEQAEQNELDNIQRMLNQLNKSGLNVTEELVGGEFMVQSFIVKTKEPVTPFEEKIRQMKKPSESND
jgi:negative regulator of sigma E activity